MTIIAFDGRYMVGDSLSLDPWDTCHYGARKVRAIWNNTRACWYVAGQAGKAHLSERIFKMLATSDALPAEMDFSTVDTEDYQEMLLVTPDGTLYRKAGSILSVCSYKFWGLGIGRDYAIAAMDLGKSAEEACKLAIKYNAKCGGELRIIDCHEVFKKERAYANEQAISRLART